MMKSSYLYCEQCAKVQCDKRSDYKLRAGEVWFGRRVSVRRNRVGGGSESGCDRSVRVVRPSVRVANQGESGNMWEGGA